MRNGRDRERVAGRVRRFGRGPGLEWTARPTTRRWIDPEAAPDARHGDVRPCHVSGHAGILGADARQSGCIRDGEGTPEWVNAVPKVVFSTTLRSADLANTTPVSADLPTVVKELKQGPGQTIAIYASPRSCTRSSPRGSSMSSGS